MKDKNLHLVKQVKIRNEYQKKLMLNSFPDYYVKF